MPDVGLLSAGDPVPKGTKVVVKYAVEVGGLPVYQESYDVDTLARELKKDQPATQAAWLKRLHAPVDCRDLPQFSAELTRQIHSDSA